MSFLADDTFSNVHYKQEVFDFELKDDFRLDTIVASGKQFDLQRFWDSDEHDDLDDEDDIKNYSDLTNGASNVFASSEKTGKQEDFHQMLNDWQDHLSSMKTFDEEHPDSSAILTGLQNSVIDELLPEHSSESIYIKHEAPSSESHGSCSSQIACKKLVEEEEEAKYPSKRVKRNSLCALEAEDAKSLLEQFEASEIIYSSKEIKVEKTDNEITNDSPPPVEPIETEQAENGESVQLDHDYCNGIAGSEKSAALPPNFYHSTVADYGPATYSRLPEYYAALATQKSIQPKSNKDSKKDSGLESGDVSDASEEVIPRAFKNVPMVSVLKRNYQPKATVPTVKVEPKDKALETGTHPSNNINETLPRKRKLNLEEYRSRLEEREKEGKIPTTKNNTSWGALTAVQSVEQKSVTETASSPKKVEVKSVEVQATPEEIISATAASESSSRSKHKKSGADSPRRRRQYRSRRVSSSSSTSTDSRVSRHHRSHKRRKTSRSDRRSRSRSRGRSTWSRSRSRSRSSSASTTYSTCSSISISSRNRSRTNSSSRRHGRNQTLWKTKDRFTRTLKPHERRRRHSQSSRSSNRSSRDAPKLDERDQAEKMRQVEERRVIYVGRIEEGTTKADLRQRFEVFGPIVDISVHFRDHGDNYGFVTFAYKVDAYEAVEHGNDDVTLPQYDLSFGGRRAFCKQRYSDLDIERQTLQRSFNGVLMHRSNESFDSLLREAQAKLRKRSSI